ncbi:tyrosine-type recombinase/integrase [Bacteroides uniformis]|uniref:tyrosine-type recombinase/integrase n=1 Tax=Bacteroides uniformis TaxID=820 RepID=UPI003DA4FB3B
MLAKCLIINVLRLIIVILFFIAFLNITYTARHTFATMMLTLGADLYTVSKLLGHTSVRMTQVYAKIINQKKDEAVNLVNGLFD